VDGGDRFGSLSDGDLLAIRVERVGASGVAGGASTVLTWRGGPTTQGLRDSEHPSAWDTPSLLQISYAR
jgi:hypothetical protein